MPLYALVAAQANNDVGAMEQWRLATNRQGLFQVDWSEAAAGTTRI